MLTDTQILENKQKFITLLTKTNVDLTTFVKYLESSRVDFFNKPYSICQGEAYAGGLCEFSLRVYDELQKLVSVYNLKYEEKDLIIVALLSELYRAELIESYIRSVKNETTRAWEDVVSYRNKEERPIFGDINFSSFMILKKFFNLENDEIVEAICFSSLSSNYTPDIHNIRKDYKLVTLLTMAKIAATYFVE